MVSVENGCSLRKLLPVRVTLALERQIGQMVYNLYALKPEEIGIVEGQKGENKVFK
jgi:hypothetical protein